MPPRKSDASKAATGDEGTLAKDKDGINVEELALPKTMVMRLAKGVLPPNTQVQKDAMLAMSKSATVFVNYLASHAQEYTERANKKTIMPKHVLDAISELEFESFLPRLEAELAKYNEVNTEKRNIYRKKVKEDKAASNGAPLSLPKEVAKGDDILGEVRGEIDKDSPPAAKRARKSTLNGVRTVSTSSEEIGGRSADDTMSEHDSEPEANELDDDEDGSTGSGEEDNLAEDVLETEEVENLEDEALDNGDDSD